MIVDRKLDANYWHQRHKVVRALLDQSLASHLPCAERDAATLRLYLEWIKGMWLKAERRVEKKEAS